MTMHDENSLFCVLNNNIQLQPRF